MHYVRLFSDPDGESHLEDLRTSFSTVKFAPPAPPVDLSGFVPADRLTFLSVPSGWFGDWHPAPRRQYFLLLRGEMELQVSDGEIRRLKPGDVVLGEDTQGKGHRSRAVGTEDLIAAIVQLTD